MRLKERNKRVDRYNFIYQSVSKEKMTKERERKKEKNNNKNKIFYPNISQTTIFMIFFGDSQFVFIYLLLFHNFYLSMYIFYCRCSLKKERFIK